MVENGASIPKYAKKIVVLKTFHNWNGGYQDKNDTNSPEEIKVKFSPFVLNLEKVIILIIK